VIRGFSAYFLQRSRAISALSFPEVQVGTLEIASFPLTAEERLAVFVVVGVLVSLVGVRIASYFSGAALAEPEPSE
jgi:putative membrane protein